MTAAWSPCLGDSLSGLADGELTPDDALAAQAHLAVCRTCTREFEATVGARALVRGLPTVDPRRPLAPAYLLAVGRRWAAPVAAAAAAVAMVLLTTVGGDRAPTQAPVARLVQVHATSAVNTDPVSQLAPSAIPVSFVDQ
ncbi:MAG: anti-sigma factor family protein [Acidimicrobiales bacterium]